MMPIKRCALPNGEMGFKWGDHGHCYATREGAVRQAQAAHANGYTGKNEKSTEEVLALKAMGSSVRTRRKRRYGSSY